ncbi:MAG: hypothetical protein HOW73_38030 [Polyangiaceae bacterium]|nr:hypothetical protein [Polyangiaceae bacterium]
MIRPSSAILAVGLLLAASGCGDKSGATADSAKASAAPHSSGSAKAATTTTATAKPTEAPKENGW